MAKQERMYLTAVTISGGIITLIGPMGNICYYRQRGIQKIPAEQRRKLICMGLLQRNWEDFKELPSYVSISYEDPSIMGRARATYPNPSDIIKAFSMTSSKQSNTRK